MDNGKAMRIQRAVIIRRIVPRKEGEIYESLDAFPGIAQFEKSNFVLPAPTNESVLFVVGSNNLPHAEGPLQANAISAEMEQVPFFCGWRK